MRDLPVPSAFLNALFVVDIHIEIGAVLLGQGDAFVVDHGGMLDRRDARPDRILDSLGRMRMRLHAQSEMAGLIHCGLQLFQA